MVLARRHTYARLSEADRAESLLRNIDQRVTTRTGTSLFHILTLASLTASVILFLRGRKFEGLFVGLWPATFEALKSAAESRDS
jgi:hypothetical protein